MKKKKAQVFILLGQSNAVGHQLPMSDKDKIVRPLRNVFGLHRKDNQSFNLRRLIWNGYVSGGMNLGETQDDMYSLANCLAALWQQTIDAGVDLPDLYVVQIAVGAQGVTEKYMWNPKKEEVLIPGDLKHVRIALFPFTCKVLSLLDESFQAIGTDYEVLGLHWRGGEEEMRVPIDELKKKLTPIYDEMFGGFQKSLARPAPIVLHKLLCEERTRIDGRTEEWPYSLRYVNQVFEELALHNGNVTVFDTGRYPGEKLFMVDCVHYTADVNRWVALQILENAVKRLGGTV